MNKNEISQLVQRYKNTCADDARCEVIKSPLDALSKIGVRQHKKQQPDAGLNGPGRRLQGSANYAAQMLLKAVNMAENAGGEALLAAGWQLSRLIGIAQEAAITINKLLARVSPGKQSKGTPEGTPFGGGQEW